MSEPITAATKAETPTDPCEPPESGQEVSVSAPPSLAYTVERLVDGEWLPFRRRVSAAEAWNYYVMAREGFSARVTMCEEELLVGDLAGLEAEYYARKLERAHPADVPLLAWRAAQAVAGLERLVVTPDQEAARCEAVAALREVATAANSRVSLRQTFVVESVETADTFAAWGTLDPHVRRRIRMAVLDVLGSAPPGQSWTSYEALVERLRSEVERLNPPPLQLGLFDEQAGGATRGGSS